MNVYVLTRENPGAGNAESILGVYATMELAQAAARRVARRPLVTTFPCGANEWRVREDDWGGDDFAVTEFEVVGHEAPDWPASMSGGMDGAGVR